jgi:hypothetical protein
MEQCINRGEARLNAIVREIDKPAIGDPKAIVSQFPLVLLRGSCADPKTLILTDEDQDALIEKIGAMQAAIVALAKTLERSILFIGTSPRDPLIHALSQKLLEPGPKENRTQGTTFFVWPAPTPVDEAYWSRYDTEWISGSDQDVIDAISAV